MADKIERSYSYIIYQIHLLVHVARAPCNLQVNWKSAGGDVDVLWLLSEPDFPHLEALAPYQPLAMKVNFGSIVE